MNKAESIVVDVYPWAEPTEEQKKFFDSLPPEEKRRMIEAAVKDGIASGPAEEVSVETLIEESKAQRKNDI